MSKTFTYTKITGRYYLDYTDEWEEDGIEFEYEYEVDDDDLLDEVVEYVCDNDYFGGNDVRKGLRRMIIDLDLLDVLVDIYEEELKEAFKQEALDSYD